MVAAAKANDQAKLADANRRWSANADQIADFLSKANPKNWPDAEMRTMMHDHLTLTTNEAVARLHGDWAGDVKAYDAVHTQILHMAAHGVVARCRCSQLADGAFGLSHADH